MSTAKIYLSSTYSDLIEIREDVYKTLRKMGLDVIAMEDYVASDERPLDKCLDDVRNSDMYIGVFAWRYGYIPKGYDKSITELEYREAVANNIPTFLFFLTEDAPWPKSKMDKDDKNITTFRNELLENKLASSFKESDELCTLISIVVSKHLSDKGKKKVSTQFLRSPWLGIQFYQDDKACPMIRESEEILQVILSQAAFEIRVPHLSEGSIVMLTASWSPGIFEKIQPGNELENIPFFRSGTGMADTSFGDGTLMINTDEQAHHYLDWGGRIFPGEDKTGKIMFNRILTMSYDGTNDIRTESEIPKDKNIYVVIHKNGTPLDNKLALGSFEKFVLNF
jgi:hypothetical protein